VTSQEPRTPQSADRDIPDTEAIVVSASAPVFVDATGRRGRLLRWVAYAFGGVCMLYGGLISVTLAGGPVSPSAILPLPDLPGHDSGLAEARPRPTPEPIVAVPPKPPLIGELLPRHGTPVSHERRVTPAPAKSPSARPTSSKPAATTTPPAQPTTKPSASPTPTPIVSVEPPGNPVAPKPPAASTPAPPPPSPPSIGGTAAGGAVEETSSAVEQAAGSIEESGGSIEEAGTEEEA
jgi:hypothetical protein